MLITQVCLGPVYGQAPASSDPVLEGSKLIVELVKVFSSRKEQAKDAGCKGRYADLCVENRTAGSIMVVLEALEGGEKRELIIMPSGKECCLQLGTGVWTYDLRMTGSMISMRKGDLRIEGCQNLSMQVK